MKKGEVKGLSGERRSRMEASEGSYGTDNYF